MLAPCFVFFFKISLWPLPLRLLGVHLCSCEELLSDTALPLFSTHTASLAQHFWPSTWPSHASARLCCHFGLAGLWNTADGLPLQLGLSYCLLLSVNPSPGLWLIPQIQNTRDQFYFSSWFVIWVFSTHAGKQKQRLQCLRAEVATSGIVMSFVICQLCLRNQLCKC